MAPSLQKTSAGVYATASGAIVRVVQSLYRPVQAEIVGDAAVIGATSVAGCGRFDAAVVRIGRPCLGHGRDEHVGRARFGRRHVDRRGRRATRPSKRPGRTSAPPPASAKMTPMIARILMPRWCQPRGPGATRRLSRPARPELIYRGAIDSPPLSSSAARPQGTRQRARDPRARPSTRRAPRASPSWAPAAAESRCSRARSVTGSPHASRKGSTGFAWAPGTFAPSPRCSRSATALRANVALSCRRSERFSARGGERLVVLDNHEDDRAMARLLQELSGTPATFVITARRCLLAGVLVFPVTAPLVTERSRGVPARGSPHADAALEPARARHRRLDRRLGRRHRDRARGVPPREERDARARHRPRRRPARSGAARGLGMGAASAGEPAHPRRAFPHRRRSRRSRFAGPARPHRRAAPSVRLGLSATGTSCRSRCADDTRSTPSCGMRSPVARRSRPSAPSRTTWRCSSSDPERLDLEQTHLFAAMDYAHRSGDLRAMLRIERLLKKLEPPDAATAPSASKPGRGSAL